ncbi:MAG: magnesium transporter [Candidatus Izimaplasma sp.]|nr:magnesium transporter [Candidatus Izimaplasma bacterium]
MGNLYISELLKIFSLEDEKLMKEEILAYHPYEVSETLLELSYEDRKKVYKIFSAVEISEILSFLDTEEILALFNEMTPRYIVNIIQNFDIDDAVDIIQSFPNKEQAGYLKLMDQEHRDNIKELLQYEEDTAGAIMTTEYIEIHESDNVEKAMKKLISQAVDAETIDTLYVTNDDDYLQGTISLREMILARKGQLIKDIMNQRIISVKTSMDQEDVAEIFMDYDFTTLPVVDTLNRMIGIITIDDIVDVIEEEAVEDYSRLAGISDVEIDSENETIWMSTKKRLPWLLILSVLGFLTSTIIAQFEATLDALPTIALFMPMILGMAGNTGTQSLAVTVRGLNNGEFDDKASVRKHLIRESGTGLLNGIMIGIVLLGLTYLFLELTNTPQAFIIAQVVCISIIVSLTVSTFAGAIIPTIINFFKIDPAVASGPFVTMINDMIAVSVYFTLATVLIINTL